MSSRLVHTLLCLLMLLGWSDSACASAAAPMVSGLPGGLAGVPMTRQFSAEDFGASPQHLALSTDADGRLLVGNVDGLLRFDGETWRLFELPTRSPVRSIGVGADRRLYLGSYDTFGWMEPDGDGGLVYRELLDAADELVSFLLNNKALQSVDAIKNQRFIVIPYVQATPGIDNVLAVETLAKGFHGE